MLDKKNPSHINQIWYKYQKPIKFSQKMMKSVFQVFLVFFFAVRNKGGGLGTHAPKGNIVNIAPNWCRYLFKYWEEFRERVLSKSDKCQNILLSKVRDRYIHVNLVIASIRSTHQVSFNHNISRTHFFLERLISLQHCGFLDDNYNFKVEKILKGSIDSIWTPSLLKTKKFVDPAMFCLITSSTHSWQKFDFSLKVKVMGSNPSHLLKSVLL